MPPNRRPTAQLTPSLVASTLACAAAPPGSAREDLVAIGIDVVDAVEFRHNHSVGGERWLHKVFTSQELADCGHDIERLATRFAAKEAVAKVLGSGFREGVSPRDIEVVTDERGHPSVHLHGKSEEARRASGLDGILVSMSREGGCAAAVAVGTGLTHAEKTHEGRHD